MPTRIEWLGIELKIDKWEGRGEESMGMRGEGGREE